MNDYSIYKLYSAVKLHFTNYNYNVIESRGVMKTCIGEDKFLQTKKNYISRFHILKKQFKTSQDWVQLFVALNVFGGNIFDQESCDTCFIKWQRLKESATQTILDDIDTVGPLTDSDTVLKYTSQGRISIATAVALDKWYDIFDTTSQHLTHDKLKKTIAKVRYFLKYNQEKVNEQFKELEQYEAATV